MHGQKFFATFYPRKLNGFSLFPTGAVILEGLAILIAACALFVAGFQFVLGLWVFVAGALFVCGAFSYGAAMLRDFRKGR